MRLPFLEDTTPPPFYQPQLSDEERTRLDKLFIGQRSQSYYLKRFEQIDRAGKLMPYWHWAAFLMTFGWLLYRKRYLDCFVYCVAGWSFIQLTIVIGLSLAEFLIIGHLPSAWQMPSRIGFGVAIWLFWAIQVARWADAYYYRMARREIADVLELYPYDKQAQKVHLQTHGSISLAGMGIGFLMFFGLIAIIVVQFVPIVQMQKEKALIDESYQFVYAVHHRIEGIYRTTGRCPTHLPLSANSQKMHMQLNERLEGIETDCAIILTVTGASFPIRYLNGQTLVMYRSKDTEGKVLWRCQTSLNKKRKPKRCVG